LFSFLADTSGMIYRNLERAGFSIEDFIESKTMKTQCPNCDASDKAPTESSSQKTKCWRCGEWYTIAEGKGILLPQQELTDRTNHSIKGKMADPSATLKGIYGWLMIPAIGLIYSPIKSLVTLIMWICMIQNFEPELLSDARLWLSGLIQEFCKIEVRHILFQKIGFTIF